ncbi:MAG: DoxX family membrane protein [Ignavibacterium sp.]|nr:DoxX family membrane protein [Ignavibacterium sp.]
MKRNKILEIFLLIARVFLAFIFIYAGIEKISNLAAFSQSIQNYRLLPVEVINLFAITIPWIELICGLLLLFGISVRENSLIISSLLFVFTLAVAISMIRGLNFDCGCFGKPSPIGWKKLGENSLMLILGILLFIYDSKIFIFSSKSTNPLNE